MTDVPEQQKHLEELLIYFKKEIRDTLRSAENKVVCLVNEMF